MLHIGVTVLMGFGAINSQNNLLFLAFGIALGAILLSGLLSGVMMLGVRAERQPTLPGTVGEPMTISYVVRNRSLILPAFALNVEEAVGGRVGRRFRRRADHQPWSARMERPRAWAVYVPARGQRHVRAVVRPRRRGPVRLDGVRVVTTFPFGIVKKSVTFPQPETALIRPRAIPVSGESLGPRAGAAAQAERSRATAGRDVEFHSLREYMPGDSMRQIAWRATARTGELIVRENVSPATRRVWIALNFRAIREHSGTDVSSEEQDVFFGKRKRVFGWPFRSSERSGAAAGPTDDPDERAISVAAGLIERAVKEGAAVGLVAPAAGLDAPPGVGGGRMAALLDELARIDLSRMGAKQRRRPIPAKPGVMIVAHAKGADRSSAPAGARHLDAETVRTPGEKQFASGGRSVLAGANG